MPDIAAIFRSSPDPRNGWLVLLAIAVGTWFAGMVLAHVLRRMAAAASAKHALWRGALLNAATLPLQLLVGLAGLSAMATLAESIHPGAVWARWPAIQHVLAVAIGALFLSRLIARLERDVSNPQLARHPMDPESALALGKLARVTIVGLATLMILETLGFSISGVLAFGGVGGIAIGFAAKDMLSNFFGGLMIYLDKPFSVGNWVRSPDAKIEGTVEDIGWRLTRIRTFEERPLYVPNALFNTIVVENVSRMQHFRIKQVLGLSYNDYERVQAVRDDLRAMLQQHPGIAQDQTLLVRFVNFNTSTLDMLVYCFAKTTDWSTFMAVQEDVLMKMGDIVNRHGASFAFPTQTVYNIDDGPAEPTPPQGSAAPASAPSGPVAAAQSAKPAGPTA